MKFYVQHAGGELMFPSFKDFQSMYRMQFISPSDLVRRENSDRWIKAGDMPELRLIHSERHGAGRKFTQAMWLMVGLSALLILFQLFFRLKPLTGPQPPRPPTSSKPAH
jgi:hypothetical protein